MKKRPEGMWKNKAKKHKKAEKKQPSIEHSCAECVPDPVDKPLGLAVLEYRNLKKLTP